MPTLKELYAALTLFGSAFLIGFGIVAGGIVALRLLGKV